MFFFFKYNIHRFADYISLLLIFKFKYINFMHPTRALVWMQPSNKHFSLESDKNVHKKISTAVSTVENNNEKQK